MSYYMLNNEVYVVMKYDENTKINFNKHIMIEKPYGAWKIMMAVRLNGNYRE